MSQIPNMIASYPAFFGGNNPGHSYLFIYIATRKPGQKGT